MPKWQLVASDLAELKIFAESKLANNKHEQDLKAFLVTEHIPALEAAAASAARALEKQVLLEAAEANRRRSGRSDSLALAKEEEERKAEIRRQELEWRAAQRKAEEEKRRLEREKQARMEEARIENRRREKKKEKELKMYELEKRQAAEVRNTETLTLLFTKTCCRLLIRNWPFSAHKGRSGSHSGRMLQLPRRLMARTNTPTPVWMNTSRFGGKIWGSGLGALSLKWAKRDG